MLKVIEQVDARRRSNRSIIRNIKFQPTVDQAVEIILASDWDFIDRRKILQGEPDYLKNFLRSLLAGRAMSLQELGPSRACLLRIIVDAWLRSN